MTLSSSTVILVTGLVAAIALGVSSASLFFLAEHECTTGKARSSWGRTGSLVSRNESGRDGTRAAILAVTAAIATIMAATITVVSFYKVKSTTAAAEAAAAQAQIVLSIPSSPTSVLVGKVLGTDAGQRALTINDVFSV